MNRRLTSTLTAAAALAMTLGALAAPSASATPAPAWADDDFGTLCVDANCFAATYGTVHWGNRTASVEATILDLTSTGYYDAFADARKIDSESFWVLKPGATFVFPIGDPNLRGGIDRVRIQVCWENNDGTDRVCSDQENTIRN